jgi:hypothetical protein
VIAAVQFEDGRLTEKEIREIILSGNEAGGEIALYVSTRM